MQAFNSGPFSFTPRPLGQMRRQWTMRYGVREIAMHTLDIGLTQSQIIDSFSDAIADFTRAAREEHAPTIIDLIDSQSDERLASFAICRDPGLTPGLIDDRSQYWLRSKDRLRSMQIELSGLASIPTAPRNSWIAGLLPDDVLTSDSENWRAPSNWELRHVVGEGSFTGISGAHAAALVGISPQNFRKYTAHDTAKNRQPISFAAWHLLLHQLEVKAL